MIITQIESAIIDRLTRGLGKLVREVRSYSGELDGEPAEVVRKLPGYGSPLAVFRVQSC